MCGIFGYIGKNNNGAQIVFEGLKTLEYRGYDSWGVGVAANSVITAKAGISLKASDQVGDDKRIVIKKAAGKIGNNHVNDLPKSTIVFGHTRWATHGGVTQANAHPHLDCSATLAIIHNGIVENYLDLKLKLSSRHRIVSQTDTEIVVHLIEEKLHRFAFAEAVRATFNQLTGLSAIIVLNAKTGELIAARNGSPLVLGFGKDENFLASDALALLPHTKRVYFLEDNEMAVISEKSISVYLAKTGKEKKIKPQKLNWQVQDASLGNYPHFMLKEIYEQPKIISEIATSTQSALKLAKLIRQAYGTYLIGCGSASYAALAGEYLFSKIAHTHINVAVGSEFGYHLDFLTDKSLVVAVSQSGETIDILESIKKAKAKKAQILALVNVLGSSLYREAHEKVLISAGPEIAVASTKALTGMLAHLINAAFALNGKAKVGQQVLLDGAKSTQALLAPKATAQFKSLAQKLKQSQHIFVIGRGLSYPAALETALKIKEISYIHAEGMASGELKHGTLALVETGTPVIVFLPNDETYGANLAGAMEMKARGATIIGVSDKSHEIFDELIEVADAKEATIIPNIVAAQLLAYYLTIERGFDPDKPRNLAKSVTVK